MKSSKKITPNSGVDASVFMPNIGDILLTLSALKFRIL